MESALPPLERSARAALQADLVCWYRAERRDLPWRRTRDPYAVWISEAMLQQTRVETVVPYFERFMERFPDVRALAEAEEQSVLGLWSGLGYYSRARALHRAARVVVERHAGRLPRRREQWLELPGIGPYTAGAVCSIAFDLPEPLVDGNVTRVFARLFLLEDAVGSPALVRRGWELARRLVPAAEAAERPGEWNQALMELGARVCTTRSPGCERCPVRAHCGALRAGRVDQLPRPRPRRELLDVQIEMLLAEDGERVLLVRRPARGRMAGLWELPTREVDRGAGLRLWPASFPDGLAFEAGPEELSLKHAITHHRVRAAVRRARLRSVVGPSVAVLWADAGALAELPLTGLTRKALGRAGASA